MFERFRSGFNPSEQEKPKNELEGKRAFPEGYKPDEVQTRYLVELEMLVEEK